MKRAVYALVWLWAMSIPVIALDAGDVSPVPEPSSVVLLGAVAGGVAYAVWRNRRKN